MRGFALTLSLTVVSLATLAQGTGGPLTAELRVVPVTAKAGDTVELQLTLTVTDPWHLYADTPGSAGQQPLKIETRLPEGLEAAGEWIWPPYESVFEGYEVHIYEAGEHVFRRKMKVESASGPIKLKVTVTSQCCTPEYCGPVEVEEASAVLQVGDA